MSFISGIMDQELKQRLRIQELELKLSEKEDEIELMINDTGWGSIHEAHRYRQIHPEVEQMGGWANYRHFMTSTRYKQAKEFNDLKQRVAKAESLMKDWNEYLKRENKIAEKLGTTIDDYFQKYKVD